MNMSVVGHSGWRALLAMLVVAVLFVAACTPGQQEAGTAPNGEAGQAGGEEAGVAPQTAAETAMPAHDAATAGRQGGSGGAVAQAGQGVSGQRDNPASYTYDVSFTLRTTIAEGRLAFVGVGGQIDGVVNPTLRVRLDQVVQVVLVNGDGAEHDVAFADFGVQSELVVDEGASTAIVLRADQAGEFFYFCTVPGHRQAGMEGRLVVGDGDETEEEGVTAGSIARDPADLPEPVGERAAQTLAIELETVELEAPLHPGRPLAVAAGTGAGGFSVRRGRRAAGGV